MPINKERLHELVEKIPKEYYEEVERELQKRIIPIVEPTDEERKAIKESRKEIRQGDFHTLDDFLDEIEGSE